MYYGRRTIAGKQNDALAEDHSSTTPGMARGPRAPFEPKREFAVQAEKLRSAVATQLA